MQIMQRKCQLHCQRPLYFSWNRKRLFWEHEIFFIQNSPPTFIMNARLL